MGRCKVIAHIILKQKHRTASTLFGADICAEVNEVYITTAIIPVIFHRLSSFLHSYWICKSDRNRIAVATEDISEFERKGVLFACAIVDAVNL